MADPPTGTITFLFMDIEGSTLLWQRHPGRMRSSLARQTELLQAAIDAHDGFVFKTIGDAFCAAFQTAPAALAAALDAQRALAAEPWPHETPIRVRMGLHTGVAEAEGGDYFGQPLNRVARLMGAGHGGQILLSAAAWELVRDDLPAGVSLRDLGERRLKDLRRPERVYQVLATDLPADFPPLATLDARPHNLPVQWTSFVGRERELAAVKRTLLRSHLVTLTGIGGTGKTRLALQAAADLTDDFDHGVWFVDLAAQSNPHLVANTVAAALGIREEPGVSIEAALIEVVAAKRLLIVLDNCEHLIQACAEWTNAVLRGCPGVRILATSREALAIAGEATIDVLPLTTPQPTTSRREWAVTAASLGPFDAVRLFVDRAVAVKQDFTVSNANAPAVAGICHRLDGIPLALELAAARVKTMTVDEIHDRLSDRFHLLAGGSRTAAARQQTLEAAIDWSHALLPQPERVLFRRLAAFRGGWTLDAAEAVCVGHDGVAGAGMDLLGRLVDKSLVVAEDADGRTRYRFLVTVRAFAQARLEDAGELDEAYGWHAQYFVPLAEGHAARLSAGDNDALGWFGVEHENLRAVLERMDRGQDAVALATRLAVAMYEPWMAHGPYAEAVDWCERLRAAAPSPSVTIERAMLTLTCAEFAVRSGSAAAAGTHPVVLFESALADFRHLGDDRRASWCLNGLGYLRLLRGEYAIARDYMAASLALKPADAPDYDVAIGLSNLAEVDWYLERWDDARKHWDEARQLFEGAADTMEAPHPCLGDVFRGLGHLARRAGDGSAARDLHERGMAVARLNHSPIVMMRMWICLALDAADAGDMRRAALLVGAATACQRHERFTFDPIDVYGVHEATAAAMSALGEDAWRSAVAEGQTLSTDAAVSLALSDAADADG